MAYLAAFLLGRLTHVHGSDLALFWPVAGVAALWMMQARSTSQLVIDSILLLASTTVVDVATGSRPHVALAFAAANLLQGLVFRAVVARRQQTLFLGPVRSRLLGNRDVAVMATAALVASVISGLVAADALWWSAGHWSWASFGAWVVRNGIGTLVVYAAGVTVGSAWRTVQDRTPGAGSLGPALRSGLTVDGRASGPAELWVLAMVTGLVGFLVFRPGQHIPLAFLVVVMVTWVGFRFTPAIGSAYILVFAVSIVLTSLAGWGPMGDIPSAQEQAIAVQLFVGTCSGLVLTLSMGMLDRQRLLERLATSEESSRDRAGLMDAIADAMTDGLLVVDHGGNLVFRNRAAARLTGASEVELDRSDEHGFLLMDGSGIAVAELPSVRALAGERVPPTDYLHLNGQNGRQATLSVQAVPMTQAGHPDKPLAVVAIHDVTRDRALTRELQSFAGVVAHDLQNPLAALTGWASMMHDQLDDLAVEKDDEVRASLYRIESSAGRMHNLIDDLLAFTRSQTSPLAVRPISLDTLVAQIVEEQLMAGRPKGAILFADLGDVVADPTLVRQIFDNVVGNALKYVPAGRSPNVTITAQLLGRWVRVQVRDNGIGIPVTERAKIFDIFHRAHADQYPGTGLGLAICAGAVARHGGHISAQANAEGPGTTFTFTLPADPAHSLG